MRRALFARGTRGLRRPSLGEERVSARSGGRVKIERAVEADSPIPPPSRGVREGVGEGEWWRAEETNPPSRSNASAMPVKMRRVRD